MIIIIIKRLSKILFLGISDLKFFFLSLKIAFYYLYAQIFIKKIIRFKFRDEKFHFLKICKKLSFQQRDFFINNINSWLYIFNKHNLYDKKLVVLEIGSYEGRSSFFLLKYLKKIELTCVDTFKPFHELKEYNKRKFNKIYSNFKKNTSKYTNRLFIVKNTSANFFKSNKKRFDLIYVDGSHKYKDVLHDARKAFIYLNNNGIIIFDDFLWQIDSQKKMPINALIEFLNENVDKLKILYVDYQLIIKKIKS